MTGDAVDHGVGGRETRRDLVVAGLAQHDPGDRRPLAVDPADGPEGEAAAGRVVRAGLDADEPVRARAMCWCCARCRRPAASRSVWRRCSRTPAGAWPDRRCAPGRRQSTRLRRRSRSGRCSGCGSCRSDRAVAFIRATNRSAEPASHRARTAAMLFADGSSSACSACRSVNCSPAATDTTDSSCRAPAVGVGDIGVGERDRRAVLAEP